MIKSFADGYTGRLFRGRATPKLPPHVQRRAFRKLVMLHAADLNDLRPPRATPATRLGALKGDRAGQHSVGVNDQWRIA